MRIGSNSSGVFAQGNIADVMVSIFNAPVIANHSAKELGIQHDGRDIKSGFVRIPPSLGFGLKDLAKTVDFD